MWRLVDHHLNSSTRFQENVKAFMCEIRLREQPRAFMVHFEKAECLWQIVTTGRCRSLFPSLSRSPLCSHTSFPALYWSDLCEQPEQ